MTTTLKLLDNEFPVATWLQARMKTPTEGDPRKPGGFRYISSDDVEVATDPDTVDVIYDLLDYFVDYLEEDVDSNKDYIDTVLSFKDRVAAAVSEGAPIRGRALVMSGSSTMTPDEYESRPEVKAALKLVRDHPELVRSHGWAGFASRLMDVLAVPPGSRVYGGGWGMPIEYQYAYKRAVAGWSKKAAFTVVAQAVKAGRAKLDGPPRREGGEISHDAEGRPRWGKKAAGLLIRRTDTGDFLLVLRSQDVMDPGVFGIPGGRVEPGETEEIAALGETEEELGLMPDVKIVDQDIYKSGDFTYVTFLADMLGEDAQGWVPTLNWENDAWIWADPKDPEFRRLPEKDVHPNVRRVIEKWSR